MPSLSDSILVAGILGGLAITVLGALAMLAIGLSRRLQREIGERQEALRRLEDANQQLQRQLDEINSLQAQLREQAVRDPLTGLYNRRYLDEMLARELARARRENYPLAVIIADIDHFKKINDSAGHAAGDAVIRRVADLLTGQAREGDIACRYGGEEFVMILPRLGAAHAPARADAWRAACEATTIAHDGHSLRMTLSAGIACFPEHGDDGERLLQSADQALYRAKAAGRNRVVVQPIEEALPC